MAVRGAVLRQLAASLLPLMPSDLVRFRVYRFLYYALDESGTYCSCPGAVHHDDLARLRPTVGGREGR
jgi:hypothetical protein